MSDFRMKSYQKNSLNTLSSDLPVLKKPLLEQFLEEKTLEDEILYRDSQEGKLKEWIDSQLLAKEDLDLRIKESQGTSFSRTDSIFDTKQRQIEKRSSLNSLKNSSSKKGFIRKGDLSKVQKVARFFMILPKKQVSNILKYLDTQEINLIVKEMLKTPPLTLKEVKDIKKEFQALINQSRDQVKGGKIIAQSILEKGLGQEEAKRVMKKIARKERILFTFFQDLNSGDLWDLLKEESLLVLSAIFSFFNQSQARFIISQLDFNQKKDLLLRLARMDKVHFEVLEALEKKIFLKMEEKYLKKTTSVEGKKILAEILQHMEPSHEEKILESLEIEDKKKDEIAELLFSIEIVNRMRDEDLHNILKDYTSQQIAFLLKGKNDNIKKKILLNVSKRRKIDIEEEGSFMGKVSRKEVDTFTKLFLDDLKRRHENNEIIIFRKDEEFIQ